MNTREFLIAKLEERTYVDPNTDCFLWMGPKDADGYGMMTDSILIELTGNKTIRVHRLSAHLFLKLDFSDKKQQACHILSCNNKNCWAPHHMYIGTNQDNILDSMAKGTHYIPSYTPPKGRRIGTHCVRGHELNKANLYVRKNGSWFCKECARELRRGETISVHKQ